MKKPLYVWEPGGNTNTNTTDTDNDTTTTTTTSNDNNNHLKKSVIWCAMVLL